ncbi:hypothetical protein JHK85_001733 [Glycine max]|nr:hypothetical protein JHK85_001733 [Glycine max]
MYVLSGWEGSAHDSKVLSDALARKNGLKVPQGKYYLVDCGFPNRRKFLAPYRGVRYHLQDFAGHGNDPENEKELFNLRHASLRNVIERIFGIFKSRFTIFKSAPPFLFKTQAELVLACAALHNFLRKECRSDEFPVEPTDESSSSSSVLPNYEDNDHEPIVQTQEQEREDANIWRTNIEDYNTDFARAHIIADPLSTLTFSNYTKYSILSKPCPQFFHNRFSYGSVPTLSAQRWPFFLGYEDHT